MGDFNIEFSTIERACKQKLNREVRKLTDTMDQMDLTDIYRLFYPNTKEYTFLSVPHGSFYKID
jgi:exonuclease III